MSKINILINDKKCWSYDFKDDVWHILKLMFLRNSTHDIVFGQKTQQNQAILPANQLAPHVEIVENDRKRDT